MHPDLQPHFWSRLAAERAARGAAALDTLRPGWARLIDRPIQVETVTDCPLGQVFGHYLTAPRVLSRQSGRLGFVAMVPVALNAAWEAEVTRRRAADDPLVQLRVDGQGSSPAGRRFERELAGVGR